MYPMMFQSVATSTHKDDHTVAVVLTIGAGQSV